MEVDSNGAPITPIAAIFRGLPHRALIPVEPVDSVPSLEERKQQCLEDLWTLEAEGELLHHHHFADAGDRVVGGQPRHPAPTAALERPPQQQRHEIPELQGAPVITPMQAPPSPARQLIQEREVTQKRRLDWMKIGCVMFKFHFTSDNVEPVRIAPRCSSDSACFAPVSAPSIAALLWLAWPLLCLCPLSTGSCWFSGA